MMNQEQKEYDPNSGMWVEQQQQQQLQPPVFNLQNQSYYQKLQEFKRQAQNENKVLFVSDLDEQIQEEYLFKKFNQASNNGVTDVKLVKKKKKFAFITFRNQNDANKARLELNGQIFIKNNIKVMFQKNMSEYQTDITNVYLTNIEKKVTYQQLANAFEQFGKIFSTYKPIDQDTSNNYGYGYISFHNSEDAQKCIKETNANPVVLNGQQINAQEYINIRQRQKSSQQTTQSIYIKNLPQKNKFPEAENLSDEDFKNFLREKIDKVFSIIENLQDDQTLQLKLKNSVVNFNKQGVPYAFVFYENREDAQTAVQYFNGKDIFKCDSQLEIQICKPKLEMHKNDGANLFTKNLKSNVTRDQLISVFSKFGNIQSIAIDKPKSGSANESNTQFGYIQFENFKTAQNVLKLIQNQDQIEQDLKNQYKNEIEKDLKSLYENDKVYIAQWLDRKSYSNYLKIQKTQNSEKKSKQNQDKNKQNPPSSDQQQNMFGINLGDFQQLFQQIAMQAQFMFQMQQQQQGQGSFPNQSFPFLPFLPPNPNMQNQQQPQQSLQQQQQFGGNPNNNFNQFSEQQQQGFNFPNQKNQGFNNQNEPLQQQQQMIQGYQQPQPQPQAQNFQKNPNNMNKNNMKGMPKQQFPQNDPQMMQQMNKQQQQQQPNQYIQQQQQQTQQQQQFLQQQQQQQPKSIQQQQKQLSQQQQQQQKALMQQQRQQQQQQPQKIPSQPSQQQQQQMIQQQQIQQIQQQQQQYQQQIQKQQAAQQQQLEYTTTVNNSLRQIFKTSQDIQIKSQQFESLSREQQRSLLGEFIFNEVKKVLEQTPILQQFGNINEDVVVITPKITGMLIDFDVFELNDILEFLYEREALQERVFEALELINNQTISKSEEL